MLTFHVVGFAVLYAVMRLQAVLPFNPAEQSAVAPDLTPRSSCRHIPACARPSGRQRRPRDHEQQHAVETAPTPPTIISPSCMLISGIMPPSAVKESCMALTAPQEAAVVMTANNDEATMPKRTSLPSMFPPVRPRAWLSVAGARPGSCRNGTFLIVEDYFPLQPGETSWQENIQRRLPPRSGGQ